MPELFFCQFQDSLVFKWKTCEKTW